MHQVCRSGDRRILHRQYDILRRKILLLHDGDDPGRAAVTTISRQLLEVGFYVIAPMVPEDFKPHRLTEQELKILLKPINRP